MNLTPRINEAIKLSSRLHREQVRKDFERTPYSTHLVAVAILLSSVTDDEDIIIAGLMHDSLEDVPNYTYEDLIKDCGVRVANIVKHVTEPLDSNKSEAEQLPWLERKDVYLRNLRDGGVESAIVSAADKIHNTESFILDSKKEGEEFLKRFHSSGKNKIWFHREVYTILVDKLGEDHKLVSRFFQLTGELENLFER